MSSRLQWVPSISDSNLHRERIDHQRPFRFGLVDPAIPEFSGHLLLFYYLSAREVLSGDSFVGQAK